MLHLGYFMEKHVFSYLSKPFDDSFILKLIILFYHIVLKFNIKIQFIIGSIHNVNAPYMSITGMWLINTSKLFPGIRQLHLN